MNMAWLHLLIRNWSNAQNCYLPTFRLLEVVRGLMDVDRATSRSSTLRPSQAAKYSFARKQLQFFSLSALVIPANQLA